MKIKKKILKPTEIDASLKYNCTNCGADFWLFLREVKTKNFRVVCECGFIFKPKVIQKIKIIYTKKLKPKKQEEHNKLLSHSINMLVSLGYSKKIAQQAAQIVYAKEKILDAKDLVKKIVLHIGENND